MSATEFWVDGHYIHARDMNEARNVCIQLYGHRPEVVRHWTNADQDELDRLTG